MSNVVIKNCNNIKEALNNKVVTMAELESNGLKPLKEEKNLQKY